MVVKTQALPFGLAVVEAVLRQLLFHIGDLSFEHDGLRKCSFGWKTDVYDWGTVFPILEECADQLRLVALF